MPSSSAAKSSCLGEVNLISSPEVPTLLLDLSERCSSGPPAQQIRAARCLSTPRAMELTGRSSSSRSMDDSCESEPGLMLSPRRGILPMSSSNGGTLCSGQATASTFDAHRISGMLQRERDLLRREQQTRRRLEQELRNERANSQELSTCVQRLEQERSVLLGKIDEKDHALTLARNKFHVQLEQADQARRTLSAELWEEVHTQMQQEFDIERAAARKEQERLRDRLKQQVLCHRSLMKEVSSLVLEREALKKDLSRAQQCQNQQMQIQHRLSPRPRCSGPSSMSVGEVAVESPVRAGSYSPASPPQPRTELFDISSPSPHPANSGGFASSGDGDADMHCAKVAYLRHMQAYALRVRRGSGSTGCKKNGKA